MAKIFDVPESIPVPEFNFSNIKAYEDACKKFVQDLRTFCVERAAGVDVDYIGEVIRFPMADSYAEYMVAALKPVQLIHMPLGDAWDFQYANRLTKKDIIEKVKQQKSLAKLFLKK